MEGDFNLHKSNSTYFTDLDISRSYLAGVLFGPHFFTGIDGRRCNMIVGAVACTFRKEVQLYRAVEAWTRLASWDDKWIYMVTHFLPAGTPISRIDTLVEGAAKHTEKHHTKSVRFNQHTTEKTILASAVTQLVFKQGRKTVHPVHALLASGLLHRSGRQNNNTPSGCEHDDSPPPPAPSSNDALRPSVGAVGLGGSIPADIEEMRSVNLPVVRLEKGWDKVNELFQETDVILGHHRCI